MVSKLSKAVIPIRSCEDYTEHHGIGSTGSVPDTIVCAGEDGKNAYSGDSGGPLFDKETGPLIGVVSWGVIDDFRRITHLATMFTRVSSYIPFDKNL